MSKTISREQAIQGLFTLGTKVRWDDISAEAFQTIIDDKDGQTGPQFTAFLKNRGRLIIGEPKIVTVDRSVAFNPAEFLGQGWSIWKGSANGDGIKGEEDQDKRTLAITELDLTKVQFVDMLKPGESSVQGEEKQKRLAKAGHICLDAGVFWFFWRNQHLIPPSWKEPIGGNTRCIFFDGTKLRDPSGNRYVLCLCWDGDEWHWGCSWLGDDFNAVDLSAVLAS